MELSLIKPCSGPALGMGASFQFLCNAVREDLSLTCLLGTIALVFEPCWGAVEGMLEIPALGEAQRSFLYITDCLLLSLMKIWPGYQ